MAVEILGIPSTTRFSLGTTSSLCAGAKVETARVARTIRNRFIIQSPELPKFRGVVVIDVPGRYLVLRDFSMCPWGNSDCAGILGWRLNWSQLSEICRGCPANTTKDSGTAKAQNAQHSKNGTPRRFSAGRMEQANQIVFKKRR